MLKQKPVQTEDRNVLNVIMYNRDYGTDRKQD